MYILNPHENALPLSGTIKNNNFTSCELFNLLIFFFGQLFFRKSPLKKEAIAVARFIIFHFDSIRIHYHDFSEIVTRFQVQCLLCLLPLPILLCLFSEEKRNGKSRKRAQRKLTLLSCLQSRKAKKDRNSFPNWKNAKEKILRYLYSGSVV